MSAPNPDRLDSWKEIARYLGHDERTVRRWEAEGFLPVHRVRGTRRSAVFAFRGEIDAWLRGQRGGQPGGNGATESAGAGVQFTLTRAALSETAAAPLPVGVRPPESSGEVFFARRGRSHGILSSPKRFGAVAAAFLVVTITPFILFKLLARDRPRVLSVRFYGGQVRIDGLNFGKPTFRVPATRTVPYFRIGNVTCFGRRPGECESGFEGDDYPLTYTEWSDTQVVVDNFRLASAGDAVEVVLWKPNSRDPQDAVVWGGNIQPVNEGTPRVSEVIFHGRGKSLHITVKGSGFGNAPVDVPKTGDTPFFQFVDYAYHKGPTKLSSYFRAGYSGESGLVDTTTLVYSSWNDSEIEIKGFGGEYGDTGLEVRSGDPVAIEIWNTKTLLATAWGGRVP